MSSMLSAPAAMPATRHGTFRSGFTPVRLAIVTCFADQARQAAALRQRHDRDQAGLGRRYPGHQTMRASSADDPTIALAGILSATVLKLQ